MADNFPLCNRITRGFEGGVANDPADAGGLTKWGVTQATYDEYRRRCALPIQPVTAMLPDEADALYKARFYIPCRGDDLSEDWAVLMFDTATLCGPGRAIAWLIQATGAPNSRIVAPACLAAINALSTSATTRAQDTFLNLREKHHRARVLASPDQAKFLKGWLHRVDFLRKSIHSGGFAS